MSIAEKLKVKNIVESNKKCLYLCLAYSATIGSCASLTANGPNLVLKRHLEAFPGKVPVEYATWLAMGFPGVIAMVTATWFTMKMIYVRRVPGIKDEDEKRSASKAIRMKYEEMGPVR